MPHTDAPLKFTIGEFWLLALILFACLRLLDQIRRGSTFLDQITIAILVTGPLFSPVLLADHLNEGTDSGHLHVSQWQQKAEVLLLLGLLYLYLWRLRKWPAIPLVLPLTVHFIFWSLIIAGRDWRESLLAVFQYLLIPFVSSLLWVLNAGSP